MEKEVVLVNPSYQVLLGLDEQSVPIGLEYCARICYKSEGEITPNSAVEFTTKMVEHKHNSTLEMRVKTFKVVTSKEHAHTLISVMPKFLIIDEIDFWCEDVTDSVMLLVTGSIRAFREMVMLQPECKVNMAIANYLNHKFPFLFHDLCIKEVYSDDVKIDMVNLTQLDSLQYRHVDVFLRHRHIAVKFIVNRAVTHEIVRHRPCSFLQESQRYCRYSEDKFGNRVTFVKPTAFFDEDSEEYDQWKKVMLFTEEIYLNLLKTSTPQAARTVLPNSCKTEIIVFASLVEWNHIFHMRTSKAAEPSMREVMIPLQKEFQQIFPGHNFDRRFPEDFK